MRPIGKALIAAAGLLAGLSIATAPAQAQPAAGVLYGSGNTLVTFDTDAPGTVTSLRPITGLGAGEQIEAIDFRDRPAPGEPGDAQTLYGLAVVHGTTDTLRLYRIDVGDGAATAVGGPITGMPASTSWDVDFDAAGDQLRLVTNSDLNLRIDPDTGTLASLDTSISPPGQKIAAIAYDEDAPGRVTALRGVIDHELVTISGSTGGLAIYGISTVAVPDGVRMGYDYTPFDPASPDTQSGFVTLSTPLGTGELYRLGPEPGVNALEAVGDLGASVRAFALLPATTAQFAAGSFAASEGDSATITVTRSGPATSTASVAYATGGGTAVAGSDYASAAGRLTFAPGETSKAFKVTLLRDDRREPDETVGLSLADPTAPLALGSGATALLTIHDRPPLPARLTLAGLPRRVTLATLLRHGVAVRVRPSAPVRALEVSLVGSASRAQISSRRGTLVLASRSYSGSSGATRIVRLKPARQLVGQPGRNVRLRVEAIARDATGRQVAVSQSLLVIVRRRR